MFDSQCRGATVEEIEQDQDEEDIEDFVAFSIKSLEGFAILDGATKGTTIEITDVGFSFVGGETEAANTKICIPRAEFPQGISVNVVSNESTPFLIGLVRSIGQTESQNVCWRESALQREMTL